MQKRPANQYEFSSLSQIIFHFTLSILQIVGALAILTLQIFSNTVQACAYQISTGFWSFPWLVLGSLMIWIVLWHRRSWICLVAIMMQLVSTLITTANIVIGIFVLLNQFSCSTSSLDNYSVPLHSVWIGFASVMKISHYIEIVLLYKFIVDIRLTDEQVVLQPTEHDEIDHRRSFMIRFDLNDSETLYV